VEIVRPGRLHENLCRSFTSRHLKTTVDLDLVGQIVDPTLTLILESEAGRPLDDPEEVLFDTSPQDLIHVADLNVVLIKKFISEREVSTSIDTPQSPHNLLFRVPVGVPGSNRNIGRLHQLTSMTSSSTCSKLKENSVPYSESFSLNPSITPGTDLPRLSRKRLSTSETIGEDPFLELC